MYLEKSNDDRHVAASARRGSNHSRARGSARDAAAHRDSGLHVVGVLGDHNDADRDLPVDGASAAYRPRVASIEAHLAPDGALQVRLQTRSVRARHVGGAGLGSSLRCTRSGAPRFATVTASCISKLSSSGSRS